MDAEAAGVEMALPGDCPLKQSSTTDFLREKRVDEKNKKIIPCSNFMFMWTHPAF